MLPAGSLTLASVSNGPGAIGIIVACFAESFTDLTGWHGVTLVPDRHMSGTNVAVVPTGAGFQWSYGQGSLNRHRAEALRLGLPLRINRVPSLGWDVDLPDDLVTTVTPAESSS